MFLILLDKVFNKSIIRLNETRNDCKHRVSDSLVGVRKMIDFVKYNGKEYRVEFFGDTATVVEWSEEHRAYLFIGKTIVRKSKGAFRKAVKQLVD